MDFFAPHTHTNYSDGLKAPADALQIAGKLGCFAYTITDHNTIDAFQDPDLLTFMELAPKNDFHLVPGVELTTFLELPGPGFSEVELVGLLFDEHAPEINSACDENQEYMHYWMQKTLEKINTFFRFQGSEKLDDRILRATNHPNLVSFGKPHIVNTLLLTQKVHKWLDNQEKLKELIAEAIDLSIIEPKPGNIRLNMREEYLYSMLKSPDETSYKAIAGEYNEALFVPKKFMNTEEGIMAIRKSGGVIALPHMVISANRIGLSVKSFLKQFEKYFKSRDIVGLETSYPLSSRNKKYYQDYRFGIDTTFSSDKRKTGSYLLPTESKSCRTTREMEEDANYDMRQCANWVESEFGLPTNSLVRLKVSDCHFKEEDDLIHYCSGPSEYHQLLEAKRQTT